MDGEPTFIDTNILVYANIVQWPFHSAALERLKELDETGAPQWLSRQIMREYLATMTRPGTYTGSFSSASLAQDVEFFGARFRVAEDGPAVTATLLALGLVRQYPMGGKQIHDANIVATMQAYGIRRLLTHNAADFARFSAMIGVLPLSSG